MLKKLIILFCIISVFHSYADDKALSENNPSQIEQKPPLQEHHLKKSILITDSVSLGIPSMMSMIAGWEFISHSTSMPIIGFTMGPVLIGAGIYAGHECMKTITKLLTKNKQKM